MSNKILRVLFLLDVGFKYLLLPITLPLGLLITVIYTTYENVRYDLGLGYTEMIGCFLRGIKIGHNFNKVVLKENNFDMDLLEYIDMVMVMEGEA